MGMSFEEKSLWVRLAGLLAGVALYVRVVAGQQGADLGPQHLAAFALALAGLVVVVVIGQIVVALVDRRQATDERDRAIRLRASSLGAQVLAVGVFAALCAAVLVKGNFLFVHVLLGSWVLAQLVELGAQLFLYRRDA